jgi:hypothetical protein
VKTVELLQDIPGDGLVKGDVIDVDHRSAEKLIASERAKEYQPPEGAAGERVETIDDIVDPEVARNRRVMNATIVGGVDPGPVVTEVAPADPGPPGKAADKSTTTAAATGAKPSGGDVGGGAGS